MFILFMFIYSIVNKCSIEDLLGNVLLVPMIIFMAAMLFSIPIIIYLNDGEGPVTFPANLIYYFKNRNKTSKDKDYIRFNDFYKFYTIAPDRWVYWQKSDGEHIVEHKGYNHMFSIHPKDKRKMNRFISNKDCFERLKNQNKYYTDLLIMVQKDINNYREQTNKEMKEATERIFKKE